jgi:hypothetical protein
MDVFLTRKLVDTHPFIITGTTDICRALRYPISGAEHLNRYSSVFTHSYLKTNSSVIFGR